MSKTRLGIFFGGSSTEHEISVLSTESVLKNLDADKYEILPIGVTKTGDFVLGEEKIFQQMPAAGEKLRAARQRSNGRELELCQNIPDLLGCDLKKYIDVAFPLIHGYLGEDGALQGMFRAFQVPFVGTDVLASAVCMDKILTKRVLRDVGLPVVRSIVLHSENEKNYAECAAELGNILFIKTSDIGSSVGVSKVRNEEEFDIAVRDSFQYGDTVLVEQFFEGHEVECAVLGNREDVKASCCGEIVLHADFYSYDAKYIDADAAEVVVPAQLPQSITDEVRAAAVKAFNALKCEGMSRVDFFVKDSGEFVINEFNTIPGFTTISMYPKAWEKSGLSYSDLLDTLIRLGIERYNRDSKLQRSYKSPVK